MVPARKAPAQQLIGLPLRPFLRAGEGFARRRGRIVVPVGRHLRPSLSGCLLPGVLPLLRANSERGLVGAEFLLAVSCCWLRVVAVNVEGGAVVADGDWSALGFNDVECFFPIVAAEYGGVQYDL